MLKSRSVLFRSKTKFWLRLETKFGTVMSTHIHWKLLGIRGEDSSRFYYDKHQSYPSQYNKDHKSISFSANFIFALLPKKNPFQEANLSQADNILKVLVCPSVFTFKHCPSILSWNYSSPRKQLFSGLGSTSCRCDIKYTKDTFIHM